MLFIPFVSPGLCSRMLKAEPEALTELMYSVPVMPESLVRKLHALGHEEEEEEKDAPEGAAQEASIDPPPGGAEDTSTYAREAEADAPETDVPDVEGATEVAEVEHSAVVAGAEGGVKEVEAEGGMEAGEVPRESGRDIYAFPLHMDANDVVGSTSPELWPSPGPEVTTKAIPSPSNA